MNRFFPYKVLFNDIQFSVENILIDGHPPPDGIVEQVGRTVDLSTLDEKRKGWRKLRVGVEVQADESEIAQLVEESGEPTVTVVVFCRSTNLRQAIQLQLVRDTAYRWAGVVEVDRANAAGRLEIRAVVSGVAAKRAHRVLKSAQPWVVYLEHPPPRPAIDGPIDVQWKSFPAAKDLPGLRSYPTEPFYADLDAPVPVLYLNRDIDGFYELLQDVPSTRPERAVYHTERIGIASSVWMALLNASAAAVEAPDGDEDPSLPAGWRGGVLKAMLPRVYPGSSMPEALRRIVADRVGPESRGLQSRAQTEIGKMIKAASALRKSLDSLQLPAGGEQ